MNDNNKIWIEHILIKTILSKEALNSLSIPEEKHPYVANSVLPYIRNNIKIPSNMSDELYLYCLYACGDSKGVYNDQIRDIFSSFLYDNSDKMVL